MRLRRAVGPQTAITDVYDERRGTFLVQYPVWLILTLGLAGVVAFAVTGFAAVGKDASAPILMYVWLCVLVIALQSSIFRHPHMRARLVVTLVITLICIVVVAYLTFGSLPTIHFPWDNGGGGGGTGTGGTSLANRLESNPWTYTLINFGLLAIFWIDTIRRWVRRAMGLSPTSSVAILPGEENQTSRARQDMPSLEELISGDLIAGAVLTMALSFVLDAAILGNLLHVTPVQHNGCLVSLPSPFGNCTGATTVGSTSTLTFIDRIQALIYFPLGLIILALTAVLSGLGAAGGVDKTNSRPLVERAPSTSKSSQAIAEDVTITVLNTLRSALDRRVRHLFRNLALSLRTVAWPALVFVAILGVAQFSLRLAEYLGSDKSPQNAVHTLEVMGPGAAWGLVAALALAFAPALFVFRWRVADNTLRFMGLIGFVLLLTFWLFSLALAGFNLLLEQVQVVDATKTQPFWPLGLTTYGSLAALVIWGGITLWRRARGSATSAGSVNASAAVGAGLDGIGSTGEPDR